MSRPENAGAVAKDGDAAAGLEPPPRMARSVAEVGLPRTPPKSRERSKTHKSRIRPAFDNIILLLQGGGALGAYQGGVYQALAEADLEPNWIAGISIGSINAAIIAGNPPNRRVEKLRAFWEGITANPSLGAMGGKPDSLLARGDSARSVLNQMSAIAALVSGASGFFRPRILSPWFHPAGTVEATSYYDTAPLKATLEALIDFDRINADHAKPRLSLGAVNVRSGNLIYFDSPGRIIRPEHVMASGALPPGFPAIEIEGERYWDGGLVSNTPLQWIAMTQEPPDSLVFQVDLWSARGAFPRNLAEVATRQKEIQYSSRTRAFTDYFKHVNKLRNMLATLLEELPEELKQKEEVKVLSSFADHHAANIVQLIYRPKGYEGDSKDYEFSRRTMTEHWRAGLNDATRTLRHPEVFEPAKNLEAIATFDLAVDGRE